MAQLLNPATRAYLGLFTPFYCTLMSLVVETLGLEGVMNHSGPPSAEFLQGEVLRSHQPLCLSTSILLLRSVHQQKKFKTPNTDESVVKVVLFLGLARTLYIITVYDRIFGNSHDQITVYIRRMYIYGFANPRYYMETWQKKVWPASQPIRHRPHDWQFLVLANPRYYMKTWQEKVWPAQRQIRHRPHDWQFYYVCIVRWQWIIYKYIKK